MLEKIIEESKNLIRVVKKPLLISTLIIGTTFSSCTKSQDYSTPQNAFESQLEIIRTQDYNKLLENYGFNQEEIRRIRSLEDKRPLIDKELQEGIDKYSFDIVETKYCIKDNEEIALVRVVRTDKQTNKKDEIYFRLANNFGKWILVDTVKPPLPLNVKTYDKSTIKDNPHQSKVIEEFKGYLLRNLMQKEGNNLMQKEDIAKKLTIEGEKELDRANSILREEDNQREADRHLDKAYEKFSKAIEIYREIEQLNSNRDFSETLNEIISKTQEARVKRGFSPREDE